MQTKSEAIVAFKKAILLIEETFDKELLQMLDILENILLNMTRNLEHTAYRRAAPILDIIFNDAKFLMKDVENLSNITKDARMFNMSLCKDKDNKRNVIGRKTDLMMCSTGLELSSSEWKKVDTTTKLIEEQKAKNTRVNSVILNNILNKYFEKKIKK
ncbi:hypothetical protein BD770DRAFT_215935 [Pilaira anomala]|nr:hypothetical protein BD770DRAFT_215935 [Pilaira anomala]